MPLLAVFPSFFFFFSSSLHSLFLFFFFHSTSFLFLLFFFFRTSSRKEKSQKKPENPRKKKFQKKSRPFFFPFHVLSLSLISLPSSSLFFCAVSFFPSFSHRVHYHYHCVFCCLFLVFCFSFWGFCVCFSIVCVLWRNLLVWSVFVVALSVVWCGLVVNDCQK